MEDANKKSSKPLLVKAQKPDMSTDHSLKSATVTTSFSSNKKEGSTTDGSAGGGSNGGESANSENSKVTLIKVTKPGMANTAFQHVSKHFDFVLGVDFHWTVTPLTWIPLPLPHAFVGVIFDPMDYIHFTISIPFIKVGDPPQPFSMPMGGSIYVHGRHKATTTTSVMGVAIPWKHLTGMIPAYLIVDLPMAPHEGEVYYGSKTVKGQGSELSGNQPNHVLTCWSPPMGLTPLPTMPDKIKKNPLAYFAFYSRFLKMYVQINTGKPVLVGGQFLPHNYTLAEYAMRFAGMAIMRKVTQLVGKALGKMGRAFAKTKLAGKMKALGTKALKNINNKFLKKAFGKNNPLSKKLCKHGFEPINFVTGAMSFEWDDFELLGSTPIKCSNAWHSDKPFESMFGRGIFNGFDLKIIPDEESEIVAWNHPEELIAMPIPMTDIDDEPYYYRAQKIEMHRPSSQEWIIIHNQNTYSYTRFHDAETGEIFRISQIEYSDGTSLHFEYQNGKYNVLARITDGAGRKLLFEANEKKDKIAEIFYSYNGSTELQVSYQYDQRGNLTHVTDAFGKSIVFEYDNADLIIKRTNRNDMQYVWKYDEEGRVIETTGIDKFQHGIIKYHPKEGYNEIIYPEIAGKTEKIHYDDDQIIYLEEDALGGEIWHEYNAHNEKIMTASPEGRTVGYEYDEYGNIKTYHTPDGEKFLYSYNQRGQLLSRTEPSGASEYWEYDSLHRLKSYTVKDGNQVNYFYEKDKRLPYKAVDKKELEIRWKYNEFGQVTEAVASTGRIQQWSYDEYGRLIAYIPEEGKRSLWKRDQIGRVKAVYDIGQKPLKFKYDAYDLPIFATDGQEEWQMEYTPMGSLKKQSRASVVRPDKKAVLHFEYDAYENLSSIRNEKNETYRFLRDKNDAVIEETGFDGQRKKYTRNTDGQVIRTVFADGKQVFYDYDLAGRLVYTNYNDGFWESFQYNKSGLLEEAMNPMAKVQFERNQLGLITKEIQGEHHVEYEYDEAGNLQSLKSSLGAEVSYDYDDIGYLSQVTANNSLTGTGSRDQAWHMMMKRNKAGQETSRAMTGGITSEMEYDHSGRPVSQKVISGNTKKLHTQYQWAEGNRLQSAMNSLTGGKTEYAYDTFGSLAGAKYDDGETLLKNPDEVGNLYKTENRKDRIYGKSGKLLKDEKWYYLYDAHGNLRLKTSRIQDTKELNRIQQEEKPKKFSFFIDEVKDEKPSPKTLDYYLRTDIKYTQEDKENYKRLKEQQAEEEISHQQWKKGDWEYQWLPNGMLKAIKKPDGSLVRFEYDALGRRTAKIAGDKIFRYFWDGNVLLHEWNYNLEDRPKLSVGIEGKVGFDKEEPLDNLVTWVYDLNNFNPSAKIVNGKTYAIINDYLGTPTQAYDEQGNIAWERELDIYGNPRKGSNQFIPFLYQGQYYDEEIELAYNRFRYYDCNTGTYITQDPIGLMGNNPTLYGYVDDSNRKVDIFGLMPFDPKPITSGSVFRGVKSGQAPFFPSLGDIDHFKNTGSMPGLSTKPKLNSQATKFFEKIGVTDILEIDAEKLSDLEIIQDGKEHASIKPTDDYLKRNNMSMGEALDDWNAKGDSHPLSLELSKAANYK